VTDDSADRNSSTDQWDGLFTAPNAPFRARIASVIMHRAFRRVPVRVVFPDGEVLGTGGPDAPVMVVHRPDAFLARLGADVKIGFGESYMVGDWEPGSDTDLGDLLTPFAERLTNLVPVPLQRLRGVAERRQPRHERNTVEQARHNISRHYDLSNEMFAAFLDETMTYSSAMFAEGDDLAAAQRRKVDSVLDLAGVRSGTEVLEIGTGWGQLAIQAAGRGARVTTLTLSSEQRELALARIAAAGLSDRVDVRLQDYRLVDGSYDAIVSVEMIEAVGMEYWPEYFSTMDRLLRPGGAVGLQAITIAHDRLMATRNSYSWIHKYIFPGGIIPSIRAVEETLAAHTSLRVERRIDFGQDYARTLRCWRETFLSNWDRVAGGRFDATFRRMWEFYLAYCEAGFRSGYLGVSQLRLARP
jgi:cyclopropane-fatty-acyl-phospholipid synthase